MMPASSELSAAKDAFAFCISETFVASTARVLARTQSSTREGSCAQSAWPERRMRVSAP